MDESWERAFQAVKEQFEIDNLLPEQENSLREFLVGRNIFVNLPTGYGKSLIFQCLPIAGDALFERARGSSVIVVISPLRSLMEDQVRHLNDIGVPAIAITDDEDPELGMQQVNYVLVYGSPECLTLLSDIKFTKRESVLQQKYENQKEILPFVTQYQPSVPNLKHVLMQKWHLIQNQPSLRQIFKEPPLISFKRGKSLKDIPVRAKL